MLPRNNFFDKQRSRLYRVAHKTSGLTSAITLGFNFVVLKRYIAVEPFKLQEAIEALDRAMKVLFQHTQFHEVPYGLFHKLIEGQLTLEEEELLKSLGLRF